MFADSLRSLERAVEAELRVDVRRRSLVIARQRDLDAVAIGLRATTTTGAVADRSSGPFEIRAPMEAVLWTRTPAALGHETALDLYDLCDVNPARIHITVPATYRLRRDAPVVYELHRRDLDEADVTLHEGIPIVTVRRAILDAIEADLGGHLIDQALEEAQKRGLISKAELEALRTAARDRHRGPSGRSTSRAQASLSPT